MNTPATIPGVEHHYAAVNGTTLHYVSAGTTVPRSFSSTASPSPGGRSTS